MIKTRETEAARKAGYNLAIDAAVTLLKWAPPECTRNELCEIVNRLKIEVIPRAQDVYMPDPWTPIPQGKAGLD